MVGPHASLAASQPEQAPAADIESKHQVQDDSLKGDDASSMDDDTRQLAQLGYKSQLARKWKSLESFAVSFCAMNFIGGTVRSRALDQGAMRCRLFANAFNFSCFFGLGSALGLVPWCSRWWSRCSLVSPVHAHLLSTHLLRTIGDAPFMGTSVTTTIPGCLNHHHRLQPFEAIRSDTARNGPG